MLFYGVGFHMILRLYPRDIPNISHRFSIDLTNKITMGRDSNWGPWDNSKDPCDRRQVAVCWAFWRLYMRQNVKVMMFSRHLYHEKVT